MVRNELRYAQPIRSGTIRGNGAKIMNVQRVADIVMTSSVADLGIEVIAGSQLPGAVTHGVIT